MSAFLAIQISLIYLSLLRAGPLARLKAPLLPLSFILSQATIVPISLVYIGIWNAEQNGLAGLSVLCASTTILYLYRRTLAASIQKEITTWVRIGIPDLGHASPGEKNSPHLERMIKILVIAYFTTSFVIALSGNVVNGDAQIYHISRLITFLTQGTAFISETSMPRHAYAEIFHDLQYIYDLGIGNTRGLGLICWLENLSCFLLVSWLGWLIGKWNTQTDPSCQSLSIKCSQASQLIYISLPMPFFQSVSVKNDLALILVALILIQLLIIVSTNSVSGTRSELCFCWLTGMLCLISLVGNKAYGILSIPGLALLALALKCRRVDKSLHRENTLYSKPEKTRPGKIYSLFAGIWVGVILGLNTVIYAYHSHISKTYWSAERNNEVIKNLTFAYQAKISLVEIIFNPLKICFEWLIQAPLFKKVDFSGLLPNLQFGPYSYTFGGYFGEDIAWPGLGLTLLFFILVQGLFTRRIRCSDDSSGLGKGLFLYSVLTFLVLSQLIYWQPWYSRFIGIALIPLVPLLGFYLNAYLERGRPVNFFLIFILPLTTLLAVIKSTAILYISTAGEPSYYAKKSHYMKLESIRDALSRIKPGGKVAICSDSINSPSLYPMQLYLKMLMERRHNQETDFPSTEECAKIKNLDRRKSMRIHPLDIYWQ